MQEFGLFSFKVTGYDLKYLIFWPQDLNMCMHNCGRFIYQTNNVISSPSMVMTLLLHPNVVVERSQQDKATQVLLCMITQYDLLCLLH